MKKTLSFLLALVLGASLAVSALASEVSIPSGRGKMLITDAVLEDTVLLNGRETPVYAMSPASVFYRYGIYRDTVVKIHYAALENREVTVGYVRFYVDKNSYGVGDDKQFWYQFEPRDVGTCRYFEITDGKETVTFLAHCVAALGPRVSLTNQKLSVNGELRAAEIYNIDGSNYFKLRDMAMLLRGTGSQFSVGYDEARKTIVVKTGEAYTPAGGELTPGKDKSASAARSTQSLEIDGAAVELTAYNIGGNNFFKLRDLGEALGFDVDYDEESATMLVTSR